MVHTDYIFHDCICYTKIGGNDNSPNYINVMSNYHFHGESRVMIIYAIKSIVAEFV